MSYRAFFALASGLAKPLFVPKGTLDSCVAHIEEVEKKLNIPRETYNGEERWDTFFKWDRDSLDDELLCRTVQRHNEWMRGLWASFGQWSKKPVDDGEELTPEDAKRFWFGLRELSVPVYKWTADYYRDRMEHVYEVLRGREHEGVTLDKEMKEKPLTPRQAAAVIRLFSEYLDPADLRLDVPWDCDYLASSSDGGYEWCDMCCRPIAPENIGGCRRRGCPLQQEE